MFGNEFIADIIATIFYNAGKAVRREIINNLNPLEVNERDRVSTLCALIRQAISTNPFISSFSIQAHARDTTRRDALFVFRYKEEIKIGLVEAKLLRIAGSDLTDTWDWYNTSNQSHFSQQVKDQQLWLNQAAVWDMFIPDCDLGDFSPPLDIEGSSNIWADELIHSTTISSPNQLWTYQDVLNAKTQYLSLYDIIKDIILCNKGTKHDITGMEEYEIISSDGEISMPIPIPRNLTFKSSVIENFFSKNKSIDSLNYYRFDRLFTAANKFIKTGEIVIPNYIKQNKSYNDSSLSDFIKIVRSSSKYYKE